VGINGKDSPNHGPMFGVHCTVAGFLSSGTIMDGGNYGLYDILAALEWIKVNVQSFGGDPSHVTLMGHGHGAALVNLLAISPLALGIG